MNISTSRTSGEWAKEEDALQALDAAIEQSGAFKIYREVEGEYIQPRLSTEPKAARIDRILIPGQTVIEAGWKDGPIGIECKKSDAHIGRLVTQALDYSRCSFHLANGFTIMLRWVFIFPAQSQVGELMSVMAQNRIGTAELSNGRLCFSCGGTNGIVIQQGGPIHAKRLPMGGKRGSR